MDFFLFSFWAEPFAFPDLSASLDFEFFKSFLADSTFFPFLGWWLLSFDFDLLLVSFVVEFFLWSFEADLLSLPLDLG